VFWLIFKGWRRRHVARCNVELRWCWTCDGGRRYYGPAALLDLAVAAAGVYAAWAKALGPVTQ